MTEFNAATESESPLTGRARRGTARAVARAGLLLCVVGVALVSSCSVRRVPAGHDQAAPCLSDPPGEEAPDIEWVLRNEPQERSALDAWCWAVGSPVFVAGAGAPLTIDSLAVVVWNAHVGNGDLRQLVRDLRSGALTGAPVRHFVMLLQEVHRGGDAVPLEVPSWAAVAHRFGNPKNPQRMDITRAAEELGLSILYAPSMRNGPGTNGGVAEDRGNAILSTLPLHSPTLLELPWERQRRVAVVARVGAQTSAGSPWELRLVSAHLDNRTRLGRIYRSLGTGRERQARALAEQLGATEPTVLGADLNTWIGGQQAGAALVLRELLPQPAVLPGDATVPLPGPLPDMKLDYMLFRLPDAWTAQYRVVAHTYGSDHRPLIGWVSPATAQVAANTAAPK
jgi:endonuclease/exonuclease/phosphatase family metal-dependent hydrolase